jgi:trehalose 2-sulfotransferase
MIEGAVTGYEAEFDFPLREGPPAQSYLLASVPRSGSTYVSHLLWATGCLGAPLEYLNFEPAGPFGFASDSPARQAELWRSVLQRRTSPNGVFGLKAFPLQLQALHEHNPALMAQVMQTLFPRGEEARLVQLRRRDRTAHAISYARALASGIWRSEQEGSERPEPAYSREAVIRAGRLIDQQESAWGAMYRDLSIEPLELWYEDVLADPAKAIETVASHLGVAVDPAAAIAVPQIERQSQAGARAWAERHAAG